MFCNCWSLMKPWNDTLQTHSSGHARQRCVGGLHKVTWDYSYFVDVQGVVVPQINLERARSRSETHACIMSRCRN
jgi:hypothetical protein